jgi:homoserine kinase
MSPRQVIIRAPATTANLGPGFDCLGMALDLWAEVAISAEAPPAAFSPDPAERMAADAARRLYSHLGKEAPDGLWAQYRARIPVARGLGASAVARAAGLLGANALLGEPLDREAILALGTELEGHPDNMAAVLFGGLQVLVYSASPETQKKAAELSWDGLPAPAFRVYQEMQRLEEPYEEAVARDRGTLIVHAKLDVPDTLRAVLFVPDFEMPTDESRGLLPASLSRSDAVHNIGRAALLVGALSTGNLELLDVATQDRLHQPARSKLFQPMNAIFRAAWDAGALCAFLSGGGSTVLAFATAYEPRIARAMSAAARSHGVRGRAVITAPTGKGASVTVLGTRQTLQDMGDFYRRYFPKVFAYAYGHLGSKDDAEDVTSAAFGRTLAGGAALLQPQEMLEVRLFAAARSLVQEALTKRPRAAIAAHPQEVVGELSGVVRATREEQEQLRRIATYVERLPLAMRDVVHLKFDGDLTNAQLARVLGVSETEVRVTIARALHILRKKLDRSEQALGPRESTVREGSPWH